MRFKILYYPGPGCLTSVLDDTDACVHAFAHDNADASSQGVTTRCSLAAGLRGNGERMRK